MRGSQISNRLNQVKLDLAFVKSHTLQPQWYKALKVVLNAALAVLLARCCRWDNWRKTMRDRFLKQTSREYGPKPRLALLAAAGVLFVIILPRALVRLGSRLDRTLGWPKLRHPPANAILGRLMILAGWPFALWSIYVQFTRGRGTPVPVMATQELIIQPPYSYCRNPMALGTIVAYLGLSVICGSPGAALLVLAGATVLLSYIKDAEEQEMMARFGEAYLAYRRRVPFIIPRLR